MSRSFFDPKHIWRERMKAARAVIAKNRTDASQHAARHFLDAISLPEKVCVGLYHPINDEIDTKPLAEELLTRGADIALPVATKKPAPMIFRRFNRGDELVPGAFGVMVPEESAGAVIPDIIVAPLLGFTQAGVRLGYGGGYYDRTLEKLGTDRRPLYVGYGYGGQEVDDLPSAPLDQPLDWVVTERGAIRCARSNA